jgi:peptidoglycan hydrolase-like protein with peptidoglycan-binding domain
MATVYYNEPVAISNLQRYLRQLSYFDDDIQPISITGKWNGETQDALITFQKKNKLPPTGVADEQTWNLLFSQYMSSLKEHSEPARLAIFPRLPAGESVGYGDKGFIIEVIQYLLTELSILYDGFDGLEINGVFDAPTEAAVKEFQKRNLFPQSGRVDKRTWDRMVKAYDIAESSQR